ncbi:hypothetical protein [Xanthomonas oryzae]|uniref:Transmembrane protein n=1 Tax=Xanthomonas oryzae pv. leersiae TaxID=3112258 RepID=A0AAJ6GSC4_9XANT|nr:hypothetical protein [Xanthomonas oryzae]WIX05224.1 hypothetical protein QN060_13175 [Xanthomonas oryzae pv. oryzae]
MADHSGARRFIDLTSQMFKDLLREQTQIAEVKTQSYWLEGLLELGRNWALAVAIAGAAITAHNTENVQGTSAWEKHVLVAGLGVSILWVILACLRFHIVFSKHLKRKIAVFFALPLYFGLLTTGFYLVLLVGKISDNNAIVKICDTMGQHPFNDAYKLNECVRLREQREALKKHLEGN